MSKKNLSLLMDGFMGEANQAESVQEQPKEQATEQAEQLTVLTDKQESPKAVSSKTATKKPNAGKMWVAPRKAKQPKVPRNPRKSEPPLS